MITYIMISIVNPVLTSGGGAGGGGDGGAPGGGGGRVGEVVVVTQVLPLTHQHLVTCGRRVRRRPRSVRVTPPVQTVDHTWRTRLAE